MNLTDLVFLAQAATPAPQEPVAGPLQTLVPIVFMVIIFYFLLIRPQQKRAKEHQTLVSSIKTGDKVITSGGIHGIVSNVKDKTVLVKIAENVKVEFDRAAITSVEKGSDAVLEAK